MKTFACPSCGAPVSFKSSVSVYAVCPYCESMLVRGDVDVAAIGKMAALPDDMSPLQIGTEGQYGGEHFGIIGRLKIGWRDGAWNEWHILTDSGRRGWIGEAQGSFSVSFDVEDGLPAEEQRFIAERLAPAPQPVTVSGPWQAAAPQPAAELQPGFTITLGADVLRAVDIKQATCLGSEGELPFAAPKGRRTVAIDCVGHDGRFATVEVENGKFRVYAGSYVEWDAFRFAHLRPLEGW